MSISSQSSSSDLLPPSSSSSSCDPGIGSGEQSPPHFSSWPKSNGSHEETVVDVLSEGLGSVSLGSSSHSSSTPSSCTLTQRSSGSSSSSGNNSLTFNTTPSSMMTPSSGSSNYWSSGSEQDSAFINGSNYSPGYSSGGSSSGSPQSPLNRTSRPITGGFKTSQASNQTNSFYQKGMTVSSCPEKNPVTQSMSQGMAWKGVWGSSSPFSSSIPNSKQQIPISSMKDKEGSWKDSSVGRIPSSMTSAPFNPFAGGGYRPPQATSLSRPTQGSMSVRPSMSQHPSQPHPHQQQHQMQQQQQQEAGGGGGWPGSAWPSSSLGFHAARKFGRRRGMFIMIKVLRSLNTR